MQFELLELLEPLKPLKLLELGPGLRFTQQVSQAKTAHARGRRAADCDASIANSSA